MNLNTWHFTIQYNQLYNQLDPIGILKAYLYGNLKHKIKPIELMKEIQKIPIYQTQYKDKVIETLGLSERRIKKDIDEMIQKFTSSYEKEYKNLKKFYELASVDSTKFYKDRSNFQIILENTRQITKLDIFDRIVTSELCPFCKVYDFMHMKELSQSQTSDTNFIKIYSKIDIPDEWIDAYQEINKIQLAMQQTIKNNSDDQSQASIVKETDGLIMLKLLSTEKYKTQKILDQYTDVEIIVRLDKIIITMQTITNKGINQETTIERVSNVLNQSIGSVENAIDTSLAGTLFYPNVSLNLDIFSDMVMNNSIFSQYLKIDENLKLQKKKNQVYCYFLDYANPGINNNNMVTLNITNQIVEPRDALIRTQINQSEQNKFPSGSNYLRIRITRTNSLDSFERFKAVFSKLLTLYSEDKEDVVKFYQRYLGPSVMSDKSGRKVVTTNGKKYLKDIEKELFDAKTSNYARQCAPSFQPRIVETEEEVAQLEADGKVVLRFPKDGGYVGTGQQRNYVCDRESNIEYGHIYPGVKENKPKDIKHKEKYPVIPCCYTKPQDDSKAWKGYYGGGGGDGGGGGGGDGGDGGGGGDGGVDEDTMKLSAIKEDQKGVILGRIIKGFRFLQIDQLGELPENIKILLDSYDDKYNYYRKGISSIGSPNSFLECCLQLFDTEFQELFGPELDATHEELLEFVIVKRTEIATNSNLETIRQENYEYTVDEIRQNILDQENYLILIVILNYLKIYTK